MREVDRRSKHSRRVFLKGAVTAVPVAAVATSVAVSIEGAWADDASALSPATMKTLLKVARDIYPHDALGDSYYITAIKPWDGKAAKDASGAEGAIDTALKQATVVPLGVAERAREVAGIAEGLKAITNPNMKSDLTTALALAGAAITGALANVEINLESVKDAEFVEKTRKKAALLQG